MLLQKQIPLVKSTSQTVVETDVENTELDITDEEFDNDSDNLSGATNSSDDSEQFIQNDEYSLLSKDRK